MRRASLVLAAWSVFVWTTRIKNADGSMVVVLYSSAFVALAVVTALIAWQRPTRLRLAARVLAALTIVAWVGFGAHVLATDHPTGFKIVHAGLAVISFALSGWVLRQHDVEREREAAAAAAGLQELADR